MVFSQYLLLSHWYCTSTIPILFPIAANIPRKNARRFVMLCPKDELQAKLREEERELRATKAHERRAADVQGAVTSRG